jgi:VanZ family protein
VSASTSSSNSRRSAIQIDPRYALLTAALLAISFALSSIPDLDHTDGPVWRALFNAMHAPLFGAVAWCGYKTFSRGRDGSRAALTLACVMASLYAVFDEWHQSFVVGRDSSLLDLLVDFIGITIVLFVLYRRAVQRATPVEPMGPMPDRKQPETP